MNAPVVDIRNLVMNYDGVEVLHNISMAIEAGQVLGLAGLNGAGKTTLLKGILGLRSIAGGEIRVLGSMPAASENKRRIAYLPEKFEPPPHLSGGEFLKLVSKLYGKKFSKEIVVEHAKALRLDEKTLSRRVSGYSKGMRQKLGLLSVFISGAELLVLDEPMSGLDPLARTQIKNFLKEIEKQGVSVVFSSHILADMMALCGQVVVLHEGNVLFHDSPDKLCEKKNENPESAFLRLIENKEAA